MTDNRNPRDLADGLDWGALGRLRLRARRVADGAWVGTHASRRRGAGLEFAGHRSYVPGDDLRWLDQRALMRHRRPLVKQFETETDRTLRLALDASESMGFASEGAACSKLEFATLLAAALARIAVRSGDPVGLDFLMGEGASALPPRSGPRAFERALVELSRVRPHGAVSGTRETLERQLTGLRHRTPRGTLFVVFSDLFDLEPDGSEVLSSLCTGGRQVVVVQVLDPLERSFAIEGPVRLLSPETGEEVETNASLARAHYLENLDALENRYRDALQARGGAFESCETGSDPIEVVRAILNRAGGAAA